MVRIPGPAEQPEVFRVGSGLYQPERGFPLTDALTEAGATAARIANRVELTRRIARIDAESATLVGELGNEAVSIEQSASPGAELRGLDARLHGVVDRRLETIDDPEVRAAVQQKGLEISASYGPTLRRRLIAQEQGLQRAGLITSLGELQKSAEGAPNALVRDQLARQGDEMIQHSILGGALEPEAGARLQLGWKDAFEKMTERLQKEAFEREASDLTLSVGRADTFGEVESARKRVEALYARDGLSGPQRASFQLALDQTEKELHGEVDLAARVVAAFQGATGQIDPQDPKHREAVDRFYQDFQPRLAAMPPEAAAEQIARLVDRTGVLPKTLASSLNAVAATGDDDQVVGSASLVDLLKRNPSVSRAVQDDRHLAVLVRTANLMRTGVPDREAVTLARQSLEPANDNVRRERAQLWDTQKERQRTRLGGLTEDYRDPGFFTSEVPLPDTFQAEALAQAKQVYLATGDLDSSVESSVRRLSERWGLTTLGGARWQELAPERVYAGAGAADPVTWIPENAEAAAAEATGDPVETLRGKILAEPDSLSFREAQPAYRLFRLQDDDPVPVPVVRKDDGSQALWRPQWQGSSGEARAKADVEAESTRAWAEQELRKAGIYENPFTAAWIYALESGAKDLKFWRSAYHSVRTGAVSIAGNGRTWVENLAATARAERESIEERAFRDSLVVGQQP